jgi:RNA polymerase sigma-70 factor (ECF subfamily)
MPDSEIAARMGFFARSEAASQPVQTAEALLVERVCAGDADAFGELYQRFSPLVHGIVLARVPYDEADDLTQDVFLTAYKRLHTLRDRRAVGAWLAMIARNRAMEFHRGTRRSEELTEDLSRTDAPAAEAREVLAAIRSLPETYSETLVLRLVEGMTGQEIADRTGLKPESVRVNL